MKIHNIVINFTYSHQKRGQSTCAVLPALIDKNDKDCFVATNILLESLEKSDTYSKPSHIPNHYEIYTPGYYWVGISSVEMVKVYFSPENIDLYNQIKSLLGDDKKVISLNGSIYTSVQYSLYMKSIELVPKIEYDRDRKLNQILK